MGAKYCWPMGAMGAVMAATGMPRPMTTVGGGAGGAAATPTGAP